MIIKINIKSIIKFEQLTGKSFHNIDYQDADDIKNLLYCIIISNNQFFEFSDFDGVMQSKRISKEVFEKFQLELKKIEQFSTNNKQIEPVENNDPIEENKELKDTLFIKDIAATLIVSAGLDVNYVLNDMELFDIKIYMNAFNDKMKQQLENDRLWTFLLLSPNLTDKVNTPSKLYKFPWDEIKEVKEKKQITELEFDDIMKKSAEFLNNMNKKEITD